MHFRTQLSFAIAGISSPDKGNRRVMQRGCIEYLSCVCLSRATVHVNCVDYGRKRGGNSELTAVTEARPPRACGQLQLQAYSLVTGLPHRCLDLPLAELTSMAQG